MALTDKQIKNAKPSDKKQTLSDGGGLSLIITPTGGKYWQFNFRFDGKQKTLRLGVYPDVPLAKAREKHVQAKSLLADGIDPAAQKQEAKQARQTALKNTFAKIAAEWHAHQKPSWTTAHAVKVWRSFEVDILPELGKHAINAISIKQVQIVIERVAARGALDTAKTVLQRIKAVFNYAIRTERAENNPAVPLTGLIKAPKEQHMPALPQNELVEFYRRLMRENVKQPTRIAMLLIMLTFVRSGTLRRAQWHEIDFEAREWRIPAEKMKMKTAHIVPLADWTISLLKDLHLLTGYSSFLFPAVGNPSKPMSENTLSYLTGRMGYKNMATPHGFRSLATDVLNENGFNRDAIERQMAHAERDKVRAAYHRTEYLPQRHEMMQWYADFLRKRFDEAMASLEMPENAPKKPLDCD
ncbi:MAG: integrase arm-type DNA-binding domain-containing protein [Neisseria sp.]|nr:integrase arm-type DNA-binding domain-containing protein [Neisseria sp.]